MSLSTSAAQRFTEQELGGPCTEVESYVTVSVGGTIVAKGNGDRVGLFIMNISSDAAYIGLLGSPNLNQGLYLAPNGGSLSLTVRDDFTLPTRQWAATPSANSPILYVLEIVRFTQTT